MSSVSPRAVSSKIGYARVVRPHLSVHFEPAEAGQHLVENEAVVVRALGAVQARQAIGGQVHGVALLGKALVQKARYRKLAFH